MSVVMFANQGMPVNRWIHLLDAAIVDEVTKAYPYGWDEDHITYAWIARLMHDFPTVDVQDGSHHHSVSWRAVKARGKLEHKIGDVAVLVRFQFGSDATLTGVGLLEAKRIDVRGRSYAAMKWPQLQDESRGRSNHRVLLYDFAPMDLEQSLRTQLYCEHSEPDCFPKVHASSIPTAKVLALKDRRRALGTLGLPLAFQLGVRYLRGFDLEYDEDLVRSVIEDPVTRFVILADVSTGTAPVVPRHDPSPINPRMFDRLREQYSADPPRVARYDPGQYKLSSIEADKVRALRDPLLLLEAPSDDGFRLPGLEDSDRGDAEDEQFRKEIGRLLGTTKQKARRKRR